MYVHIDPCRKNDIKANGRKVPLKICVHIAVKE